MDVAQNQFSRSKWYVVPRFWGMPGLLIYLLLVSFAAYIRPIDTNQAVSPAAQTPMSLSAGETIGQTFVARRMGLNGIEIFLQPETENAGEIYLRLRAHPQSTEDLAVASRPLSTVTQPDRYLFSFDPQSDSWQRDYYVLLEISGTGSVSIGTAPGDTYLDGALYHNGTPIDAQMIFRTGFSFPFLIVGFARQVLVWFYVLLVGGLLYILPGWALLILLWPGARMLSWAEMLGLSGGLSLALYPLLLLWTDLVGLHLGALYAWIPSLAALLALAWYYRAWRPSQLAPTWRRWTQSAHFWPDLALIVVIGLVVSVRLLVIDSLEAPMWGDSYQHTMMAQLIVDNGGLFDSWEPYAELQTFTYHFGFHAAVAAFHWITGLALPQATLWTGQILNSLAVIALYPLAVRVGGNRWAGVGAVLIAGLLMPMPMYYVNWGRYTQLAGQIILPVVVYLIWASFTPKPDDRRVLFLAALALSGLALTHYRVLIIALVFIPAVLLVACTKDHARLWLLQLLLLGVVAGLLCLPWFINTVAGKVLLTLTHRLATPAHAVASGTQQYNAIGDLSLYMPVLYWLFLPLGIAWGFWRRERGVVLICLWWFLLFLATNPRWLNLPGDGVITNFAIFIAMYIPAGLLLGSALSWLLEVIPGNSASWWRPPGYAAMMGVLLVLSVSGLWGTSWRIADVQVMQHALVTRADVRAAQWIQHHTLPDARFLVNSFFAYNNTSIVGSDGGWWLPVLAHRQTTLPPLTYSAERGPRPDYQQWINGLSTEVLDKGLDHPDVQAMLQERGVTYAYIGQRQGQVNYSGPLLLQPDQLRASPYFRLLYHQDRVWLFQVVR